MAGATLALLGHGLTEESLGDIGPWIATGSGGLLRQIIFRDKAVSWFRLSALAGGSIYLTTVIASASLGSPEPVADLVTVGGLALIGAGTLGITERLINHSPKP